MDYDLMELHRRLREMLLNLASVRDNIEILMDRLPLYSYEDVMEELLNSWAQGGRNRREERGERGLM